MINLSAILRQVWDSLLPAIIFVTISQFIITQTLWSKMKLLIGEDNGLMFAVPLSIEHLIIYTIMNGVYYWWHTYAYFTFDSLY
jgi:hypothetical protein